MNNPKIFRNAIKLTPDTSKQVFKDAVILEFEKLFSGVPYSVIEAEGPWGQDVGYAVEVKEC